jgi:spore germination protein KC
VLRRAGPLLLALTFLLAGCWSRIEVNDLGVVLGMAIDQGERSPVRLTLFLARSGGESTGQRPSAGAGSQIWVVAREAENLSDAMREIAMASARRISLHHVRVVLASEAYARQGLEDLLDFLARNPQTRLTIRPMIVLGHAQDVFETEPQLETVQTENLVKVIEAKGGLVQSMKNFMVARVSSTQSGWMHMVHVIERPARQPGAPPRAVEMAGAALFYGDRVVETLDRKEAQALAWLLKNPRDSVVSAPCPGKEEESFSVRVERAKTTITPKVVGGKVSFTVLAKGQVDMMRVPCGERPADPTVRSRLERAVENNVAARLRDLVTKMQAKRTDPAGFGKWLQLRQPAYFKQREKEWPRIWAQSAVTVTVDLNLRHTGMLTEPLSKTRAEQESR